MLVIMRKDCAPEQCRQVEEVIRRMGFTPLAVPGADRTAICITGNKAPVESGYLSELPGVLDCVPVTKPYKMVSREVRPEDTVVEVAGVRIGGPDPVLIAGPCSVETEARTLEIARRVKEAGAELFRASAFKPRTSPYSFQGLGEEGLVTLRRVREEVGLAVVSEVMDTESVPAMAEVVDVLQVGARNMQNFSLLKKLGELPKPVLLKRGLAATLDEWLMAAEYLLARGNHQVVLCERGVRTFNNHSRNTLDLNVVPLVRKVSHLPVLVDPSHGVGRRDRVRPLARAALAAGAHGLLIEVHVAPETSYSDAEQTIDVPTFAGIVRDCEVLRRLEPLLGAANLVPLDADHPGFRDPVYRKRRDAIARLALEYREGDPPPIVDYTDEEHRVWRTVWEHVAPLHARYACRTWCEGAAELDLDRRRVPQFVEVNATLEKARVGEMKMLPVAGLVAPRDFLSALGRGVFLSTQYVRHHSRPLYTPEPDVVHELIGHATSFGRPEVVRLSRLFGEVALQADEATITLLERVYWYTLEFGLVREEGQVKVYGAGLLSSYGELGQFESHATLKPFDLAEIERTPYDPTSYQKVLFVGPSFAETVRALEEWLARLGGKSPDRR